MGACFPIIATERPSPDNCPVQTGYSKLHLTCARDRSPQLSNLRSFSCQPAPAPVVLPPKGPVLVQDAIVSKRDAARVRRYGAQRIGEWRPPQSFHEPNQRHIPPF